MMLTWSREPERQFVSPIITQAYLEVTTQCNLSCRSCIRTSLPDFSPSNMSDIIFERVLHDFSEITTLRRIVLLGIGEPLCHPHIEEILKQLRSLPCAIVLVTNGHYLDERLRAILVDLPVDELYVSWDDPLERDATLRVGSQRDLVRENVMALVRQKQERHQTSPLVGMELVLQPKNVEALPEIIESWRTDGVEKFILTNLFPYTEASNEDILYSLHHQGENSRTVGIEREMVGRNTVLPSYTADGRRRCSFIEKGTVFITVDGHVSPCIELSLPHLAYYFSAPRRHRHLSFGSIQDVPLSDIWLSERFGDFREKFSWFDFPDCSACHEPSMCFTRTEEEEDCCFNPTPCGECLWAKNIILCP